MRILESAGLVLAGALGAVAIMHFTQGRAPEPAPPPPPVAMAEPAPAEAEALPVAAPVAPEPVVAPVPEPRKPAPASRPAPARRAERPKAPTPAQPPAAPPPPAPSEPVESASAPAPAGDGVVRYPVFPPEPVSKAEPAVTVPVVLPPRKVTLAAGTLISIRLGEPLGSDRNQPGDTFSAVLDQELVADGYVIAERGARAEGRIVQAQQAGRVKGLAALALELTQVTTSDGQRVQIETEAWQTTGPKSTGEDAAKVGGGAGIGAAIGGIAGGGRGAAIGAAIGAATGAGGVLATRGKPARLSAETRIPFRLRNSVTITEKRGS